MTGKDNYRVAIVGYGLAGAVFHAPLIKSTKGLSLAAVVARSPEKQEKVRSDFPGALVLSNLEELLAIAGRFDLAVIATPNKEHASQAAACLEAGLAVVVDKPVAVSVRECEDLIAVSAKTGKLLSVFQNRRWDNDFLTVKRLISQESLGRIYRFESRFERYRPLPRQGAWRELVGADEGGGVLFDLGSHLIDQATQLFGQPDEVYCQMAVRREGVCSDDDSFLALSFPSGVKAQLWTNAVAAAQGHRFRVLGSLAAYEKYGLDPQEDALRAGLSPLAPDWGMESESAYGKLTQYRDGQKVETALKTEAGSYQAFYEGMAKALAGEAPVPVDANDALNTLRIIEAARASSQRKSAVLLSS